MFLVDLIRHFAKNEVGENKMAKPNSTDGCGTLLILFALIYAFVQFLEKNYIIICIIVGIFVLSIFAYRFLKHKKKLKASRLHQVRSLQIDSSKKYPSASQIDSANSLLEKAHHLADILNTTTNRKEFYASFYELSVVLKSLSEFEGLINFENSLPSTDLNKLKENRQASIDFLEKRIKDAESQATNGQNNASELVEETKPPQPNVDVEKNTTQHILTQQIEKLRKQIEETESQTVNDQNDISEPICPNILKVDAYFAEAAKLIIEKERASIGMLQKMFKIGFDRAAKIMDQLTDAGIVGAEKGTAPRKVLMSMNQFEEFFKNVELETISYTSPSANASDISKVKNLSSIGIDFDYSNSGKNLSFLQNIVITHSTQDYQIEFINYLLQTNAPEDLKLILCDLGLSGFEIYNGIPNLFIPVVNSVDKTYSVLEWLFAEMKGRTTLLLEQKVKNIDAFNKCTNEKMPKIVCIIDEIFFLKNAFHSLDLLIPLLLNCNRMGLYIIFFSKFDLKNLSLGKIKDLVAFYHEELPLEFKLLQQPTIETNMNNFDSMSGIEFELFCKNILQINGFQNLRTTKGSGDQGIDLLAEKDGIQYGIQCKCYSSDIGNKAVQEAFAGKTFYNCHVVAVLTNQYFTKSATELAQSNKVLLWDRKKLIALISTAQNKQKGVL